MLPCLAMLALFMRQSGKHKYAVLLDAQLADNSIFMEQLSALKFQAMRSPDVSPADLFMHRLSVYMQLDHTLNVSHCG